MLIESSMCLWSVCDLISYIDTIIANFYVRITVLTGEIDKERENTDASS